MWAQVLPKIKVHEAAACVPAGTIGWAIRKDSPQLAAILNEFYHELRQEAGHARARLRQLHRGSGALQDPTGSADCKRFEDTARAVQKYGEQYSFDPLMLAAQGYQESQLDQNARSHVGAIGIMQIMPATGAELKVGDITDRRTQRARRREVHGLAHDEVPPDSHFDETNRTLFAFACYNAGPGNIARMRKEAVKRGLDPDRWFNNVELVTAEKIGTETTTYVRNIYKYYVAYRLLVDVQEAQEKARATVKPGS